MRAAFLALGLAGALLVAGAADALATALAAPESGADEASAGDLLGTVLRGKDGTPLGTITDLLVDSEKRRVAFIGVEPAPAGRGVVALPWGALRPGGPPAGGYRAAATAASLAQDLPFAQQAAADPSFLDVRRDLLGRPVLAAAGEAVGRLIDFDVDLRSGGIGYLFITTDEMTKGDERTRAISWDAIADLANQRAIVLNLDLAALRHAPPAPGRLARGLARD